MYPKGNASPPPIGIGEVRAVADLALQTTDVLVRVKIGTGAWGAGAGTLACDATSGEWTYTPTQAETNAESFVVKVYKADCTGASQTVVTSAHDVAGYTRAYDASGNALATATALATVDTVVDAIKVVTDAANSLDGKTLQQALRIIAAATAGKISGAGTGTEVAKGLDGSTDRITATVDASGNRTAITYG